MSPDCKPLKHEQSKSSPVPQPITQKEAHTVIPKSKSASPIPPQPDSECDPECDSSEDDSKKPLIEMDILSQVLELDEDDDREFSRGMVREYFQQAEEKFDEMDKDFLSKDLIKLSSSGHFLKGSSAALGLSRVESTCEKIQHCGAMRDEKLNKDLSETEAIEIMSTLLERVRSQYKEAKEWLQDFFDINPDEDYA